MDDIMVPVPINIFIDGIKAQADLDSVRALATEGGLYCPAEIMAVLGLPARGRDGENDGAA